MTENDVDRMVRDADPARSGFPLDGAEQILLEQILSEPARKPFFQRYGGALAAAAVLVVALAVPSVLQHRSGSPEPAAPPASSAPDYSNTPIDYVAAVQRSADENPRLLIGQPGWTTNSVYGFADESGSIRYAKDGLELEFTWYADEQYQSYYVDRLDVSAPETSVVAGHPGSVFRYSDSDFAIMLKPYNGTFVEFRTTGPWTRATFDAVLKDVIQVDVPAWLRSLPEDVVTPERAEAAAAEVLDGVPLPPGYSDTFPARLGVNDRYQFAARVTGIVGCGWVKEWERAKKTGDDASRARAAEALRSSHNWPVLKDMQDEGGWSDVFWETADKTAAGSPPEQYQGAIGCS